MGGLGANIGGEQWEIAKKKKEIALQYANNLKQLNTSQMKGAANNRLKSGNSLVADKEKSSREKAIEFSKNVPKPKQRKASVAQTEQGHPGKGGQELSQHDGYY
mmetsp:Transcript_19067/g.32545  ORF Transcript_19067/g.32545 Transcript_19067/m.32545 type:complete len:104 (+) Transcript_19067:483-794(+)